MALKMKRRKEEKVVYDPFREVLSKEVISAEHKDRYQCVPVKGRSKHIEIYLDVGHGSAKTTTLLARVDIRQLGMSEWLQRYLGNTQEIWVKGRAPSTHKIRTWPLMGKSGCGLETPELRQYPASFHNV
ncbi:uncharacterized protein K444DRAFT_584416 [Hyaloscypha bicolor E]|uniref:Uncharacterized protein n=1 Tax=Hyaloscypha bicolor E TaxID=1095630 RepID=A0A2J6TKN8_9HELO|nr:uncharacterized protein K444DRAFT_584416 [Hyaloscypha bicolor E]PMD63574.1 hypothetical protein K444DRAFT_584416 [Hyaloscypha bicolor E]